MSRNKIQFGRPKKSKPKAIEQQLEIESLSIEGRGVAKNAGKTIFVEGALPGEQVSAKITKDHKSYAHAQLLDIQTPSSQRITAQCEHYEHCGGCQLQHLSADAQLTYKQQAVLAMLEHNAKITPQDISPPLTSNPFHYRRSARIGVNQLSQSGLPIVGFRRANSSKILQVSQCKILPKNLTQLFDKLRESLGQIDNAKAITHVELLQGDSIGALTFRCKAPLKNAAKQHLLAMIEALSTQDIQLQGYLKFDTDTVPLKKYSKPLSYSVNDLQIVFQAGDFLQVNGQINQQMIEQALNWLAVDSSDQILDCFSGLGNFSLPLATKAGRVVGVEGSELMVERAQQNAQLNHIDNCQFYSASLSEDITQQPWTNTPFNKLVLDPPRSGASELIEHIFNTTIVNHLTHILYIACDPSSLTRDAKVLSDKGFEMIKFCVMDMFPNTAHIESMALFVPKKATHCAADKLKAKSLYEF